MFVLSVQKECSRVAKFLLVEDDLTLAKKLVEWFKSENHLVETVSSGEDALQLLSSFKYDVLILDWNLTDITGLNVCQRYRASGGRTPVIFLTGEGDIDHKEMGFDSGADDYLVKPFQVRELSARIKSLLRRPPEQLPSELEIRDVRLDSINRTISYGENRVQLMPKESAVLEYLFRHPNRHFSAQDLLDAVWSSEADTNDDTVRTTVKTLRKKLTDLGQPDLVKTVRHVGYIIEK